MKQWLSRNKVFFETLGITLLTLAGITIAGLTYLVLENQSEIQRTQLLLQRDLVELDKKVKLIQTPPLIKLVFDKNDGGFKYSFINIINKGGIILDIDIETISMIEIAYGDGTDSTPVCLFHFQESGPEISDKEVSIGKVAELFFWGDKAKALSDYLLIFKSKFTLRHVRLKRFLQISFNDGLGRNHKNYFLIETTRTGKNVRRTAQKVWRKANALSLSLRKKNITFRPKDEGDKSYFRSLLSNVVNQDKNLHCGVISFRTMNFRSDIFNE